MRALKSVIRKAANKLGYQVTELKKSAVGACPFHDLKQFTQGIASPMIFDVGANVGQLARRLKWEFPSSTVHSFEPSPATFQKLKENATTLNQVQTWNLALGSSCGRQKFLENEKSDMSSFLEIGEFGWGKIAKETMVDVVTLDHFCAEKNIRDIDILKIDTQGYDFEVMRGAEQMMRENRIKLIYFEVIFTEMYRKSAPFDQVYRFLLDHNFLLVAFYTFNYQRKLASWTDALFINAEHHKRVVKQS